MAFLKSDRGIGLALFTAGLLTRLPFASRYLYHWDSVNFALSLHYYDVRMHQPHPPGYFFYSLLGSIVDLFVNSPNRSLVIISLISGALGIVIIWQVGRIMFDNQTGLIAAMLLLTSPNHWFHSEIALTYALEIALVTAFVGLAYLQMRGRTRWWWLTALMLGIMGGVRQNDLVFMLPLWFASFIALSNRQRLGSLILLGLASLLWLVPMVALSGGLNSYMAALNAASDIVSEESPFSDIRQLALNLGRMGIYLFYSLTLSALFLLWGARRLIIGRQIRLRDPRLWTMALWILPSLAFYVFVHLRQPGHIFTFMPGILLLVALSIRDLAQRLANQRRSVTAITVTFSGGAALIGGLFFLFAPPSLFGSSQLPLQTTSRRSIETRDQLLEARIAYISANFAPESTLILAGGFDIRHPEYYLPDFKRPDMMEGSNGLPPESIQTVVIFNEAALEEWEIQIAEVEQVTLEQGNLYYGDQIPEQILGMK